MGLWEFVTIVSCAGILFVTIVACAGIGAEIFKKHLKNKIKALSEKELTRYDELTAQMKKIEKRMANLETIVLDLEKWKNFDQAISGGKE